jgi:murein DD-endopeptidase MepM/ murein hydrolase activator NlpD
MLSFGLAAAQEGDTSNAPGGTTIHVVQRGENLFRIAMQYGITVEAITAANGIVDERYITVGQRLLIPNAQVNAPGAVINYMIKPGDSLFTLVRTYNTAVESVAASNNITNPALLYMGEEIIINQGAAAATPSALHRVRPGENIYRIALDYHVSLTDLLNANALSLPAVVFPGQRLWIPGEVGTAVFSDLPLPVLSCTIAPLPGIQGGTISVHLTTIGPAVLSGTFMGYPVQVVTHDTNQHSALFGVHAFAAAGIYPMNLTVTEPDGTITPLTLRIRIEDGGYGSETISISTEQQDLLKPEVNEPEWQQIATLMSGFTAQRYFDGLMGLPSAGPITSQFGTRRDYNDGTLNTFHSGTDFGAASGTPILAPASGIVVLAENLPVRGNAVIIDHGWGVYTGYWHQTEMQVTVGTMVAPGQVIGTVGSTGRVTGPHLHWEMWVGGVQVDPMQWVRQSFP